MRTAIIHEWLTSYVGAEHVLEQILQVFPEADLYCLVEFLPEDQKAFLGNKPARTSFIQKLPFAKKHYRQYLPLMPLAAEHFDLSSYDLIISSSHAVAKGVLTGPDQLHISYCHTPIRYAWDMQHQYLRETGLDTGIKSWITRWILHEIRKWDYRTANGVDTFIANSHFIARRIWKIYRREAEVIYPPVKVENFPLCEAKEDFYLTTSRLVPYKKVDLIVEAFAKMPDKKLVVIGDGPDMKKVQAKSAPNIQIMGYQPYEVLIDHMQRARAFVFAAEEDFGITPLEAQACGTPVVAFGKGGCLETIRGPETNSPTGVFFGEQTVEAITAAVEVFEKETRYCIKPHACRENALRFAPERFRQEISCLVENEWQQFQEQIHYRGKIL